MHRPFGFIDYNKLQMQSLCTVSDSGTISEESAILGFPAVTIRSSIERPEAMDTGGMIVTGVDSDVVVQAVRVVLAQRENGDVPPVPAEYEIDNTSQRVVNLLLGVGNVAAEWSGLRPRTSDSA
jgi:UDP-N-acetylglucosamine 2-epimerase (non-hydrolysing)